jgi:hypothetical protein
MRVLAAISLISPVVPRLRTRPLTNGRPSAGETETTAAAARAQ